MKRCEHCGAPGGAGNYRSAPWRAVKKRVEPFRWLILFVLIAGCSMAAGAGLVGGAFWVWAGSL